jgi:hypothetical protein
VTRFARFLRNLFERLLSRYYEGPNPPRHIGEEARVFRILNPRATPREWEDFAKRHAENCYRSGFTRGYEWQERDWPGPAEDPEVLAEAMEHDWSLAEADPRLDLALTEGQDPDDLFYGVPEEDRARFFDDLGHRLGTHRVVLPSEEEE